MNLSKIMEKWDCILYNGYNIMAEFIFWLKYPKYRFIINKNKKFKNIHKNDRCFIVLNGPSINKHDLSYLKNEIVFCTNYMFRSDIAKQIEPNYYCWSDSNALMDTSTKKLIIDLKTACPEAKLFLNMKSYNYVEKHKDIYFTYNKHLPNLYSIKNDLSKNISNFATVAFYAINIAMYMGFKEIYLLGLDFEPGQFKHFTNLGVECDNPKINSAKDEVCGNYWGYLKAQYESYALSKMASRKKINIINLNRESCIRAFGFNDYEKIINNKGEQ